MAGRTTLLKYVLSSIMLYAFFFVSIFQSLLLLRLKRSIGPFFGISILIGGAFMQLLGIISVLISRWEGWALLIL